MSETLKGIRRSIGTAQEGKAPLLTSDIRRIVASCPETLLGLRDRALILVGFAVAFRRSELAAIECAHLSFTEDGLIIDLRRSKTDQEAAGRKVGIPLWKGGGNLPGPPRCADGSPTPASRPEPSSAGSTAMARSRAADSTRIAWDGS